MAANPLKTTSVLPLLLAIMLLPRVVRVVDSQVCATSPYYVVNCNFTSFPRAQVLAIRTPPVKLIQVYGNRISTINSSVDFAGLSGTYYLNLMHNLFVEFPELQALGTSLQNLLLDYNPLTIIDPARLTPLVALRSLTLSYTLLSSFPDVYMPSLVSLILKYSRFTSVPALPILGKRLNSLSLTGNRLQIIDVRAMNMYTNLTALFIYDISILTTFPNFCTLPGNGVAVTVQMSGVPWVCDCRLRWLWYRFPSLSITDGATCSSPPSLAGKFINNITLSQLTCAGESIVTYCNVYVIIDDCFRLNICCNR